MERRRVSTGTEWESEIGYSRAIRAGKTVQVSGTVASDEDGEVIAPGDPYEQTKAVLDTIEGALAEAGASIEDVVRTRIYVTDVDDWDEIGSAHGEVFGEVRPATTMVEVSALVDPDYVVEIEAEAIVD